jgi:NTP pyrophosphatase (non-canonical NTP hydrolase)
MDSKTYIKEAVKTESLDFEGIRTRLNNISYQKFLFNSLNTFNDIGETLDFHKKYVFYGKGSFEEKEINAEEDFNHNFKMTEEEIRLLHTVLGIATEAQEMIDQIMNLWKNKKLDKINLFEENGDIFWYQAVMADICNKSFEDLMEKNISKLRARYGEKFSSEKAINRDLNLERKILEEE